ncbi:hypothetical protein FIBSPDRAFT_591811 [Athelia psychrophila]|uniref:Uncharacterized protein n=1 Tax=Athelia psychrophila TaxID=1759441 RepID=A0A166H3U0_9AGAM|nr:hypothetical protein FIBSPDRAFT_591811 [Fibularhizoctonia sp. CBS 109695]
MLSIEIIAWALLLGGNYGVAMSAAEPLLQNSEESHCTVQAWVRAEDLTPSSILNGDLRIKVDPSCAEDIVSVGLQLRLDEYAEVKFPKAGVVMPTTPVRGNVSEDETYMWRPFGMRDDLEGSDTEMGRYRTALRDPELWEVYGEERTAWKSAVTLHEGSIDYARPLVLPFAVATSHVQFPPGHENSFRLFSNQNSPEPAAGAKDGYRYTALVTFSDGRLEEVPAGYTTFHPVRRSAPVNQMLFTNVTFSRDGCRGDGRRGDTGRLGACAPLWSRNDDAEVHTARIDLENGGVVHVGKIGTHLRAKLFFNSIHSR